MTRLTDEKLSALLRKLPRTDASPEFTARVLDGLDRPASARRVLRMRWGLAAAAALVLGTWLVTGVLREREERRAAEARVQQMREEYLALEAELDRLRALTNGAEPVLELGGTEDVDFVFDLRRFARERGGARAEPVSMQPR